MHHDSHDFGAAGRRVVDEARSNDHLWHAATCSADTTTIREIRTCADFRDLTIRDPRDQGERQAPPVALALLSPGCHDAFVADAPAILAEMADAASWLVLLVPWKEPPPRSRRHDGLVHAFAASTPIVSALVERYPNASLDELSYLVLEAMLNRTLDVTRMCVRQIGRPIGQSQPPLPPPAMTDRAAMIMAHRGDPAYLDTALDFIGHARSSDQLVVRLGLDEADVTPYLGLTTRYPGYDVLQVDTPPTGPYVIRQGLADRATEPWLVFQDSDDISTWDRLVIQHDALQREHADLVGCHEIQVDEIAHRVEALRFPRDVSGALAADMSDQDTHNEEEPLLHATAMMRRSAFVATGGFSTDLRIANDTQFMMRAHFSMKMLNVDEFLYIRRKHAHALTVTPATAAGCDTRLALAAAWTEDFEAVKQGRIALDTSRLQVRPSAVRHVLTPLADVAVALRWQDDEVACAERIAAGVIAAFDGSWSGAPRPRVSTPNGLTLKLRLSDAAALRTDLPLPRNAGALLVRHLFMHLRCDEQRLPRWRMEHKLVQALVLDRYCPGVMPVTRGLSRHLAGLSREEQRQRLVALHADPHLVIKASLGETSGELGRLDQFQAVLTTLDPPTPDAAARADAPARTDTDTPETAATAAHTTEPPALAAVAALAAERFVVQERIEIAREYRVHTLEDRVIPDLTFRRYAPEHTDVLERDDPNAFVQTLLDALPAAFVKDTLCGWDVALDTHGRWRVIECNYSGRHLHFKPGFHCSGFFQVPRWDSSSIVSLARFAAERHHLTIDVIPDTVMVDDERAMYARVARALRNRPAAHVEAAEQKHASVLAHIDEQVRRSPEATAIVSDAGSVNYRELWARSNQLARHLHRAGVTAETCVGVCMGRSADLVTALIGILKAGAAYVPLVDRDPPDRIRQMASDARVALVLTDRSTDPRIAACGLTTIDLERGWTTIAREPDSDTSDATDTSDTAWPAHPDQLAYAIYTSGSTGRPKAVAIAHAALTNVLCHLRDMLQVTAADRWLAVTPLTFDIAAVELLLPLLTGAQVWMAGHGENGDGRTLRRRLDESGATIMQATPVTWQLLIDAGWIGDPAFRAVTGGEALSPVLATQLAARVAEVWNVYGPTETTIWSSAWLVDDRQPAVSLGEPIARTSLYILGPDGEPRPAGEPGELFIGGLGLARGYLHQPARTAEHFVPDPFATEPGARMYRTGDQVRLAGGREAAAERPAAYPHASRLEYLGRTDHQIKLRGVRIECGEIESRLRELPSIREAAVVARQDANGQPRLVAFIVRDRGARPGTHDSLQSFLRARLPDVMVPSAFVDLDALPRTPHGKIDRKSLEWTERSPSSRPAPAAIVAPVTRTEERVAAIWTTLLQVEPIGLDDDFLALGGDSLAAIACLNRVNETFAVDLPIMTVFVQTPTVRQMAALIDACQPAHVRTWARTNYAP